MPEASKPDLTEDRIFPCGWGLLFRVVCAPKSWSDDKISETVTREDPPGTFNNQWVVSEPDDERTDQFKGVSRIQCPDCENRWHVLMNC